MVCVVVLERKVWRILEESGSHERSDTHVVAESTSEERWFVNGRVGLWYA